MRGIIVCLFFVPILFLSGPSYASGKITEDSLKEFYQEMKEVQSKSSEEVVAFFDRHLDNDSKFYIVIHKHIQGKFLDDEILDMDKKQVLEKVDNAHKNRRPDKVELEITSIEIANDGRTAKVKENLYGAFTIKTKDAGGEREYLSEQAIFCTDYLEKSSKGVIIIKKSDCVLDATLKPKKKEQVDELPVSKPQQD